MDRALVGCWTFLIVGFGGITLSSGILFMFYANFAQFPNGLFLILLAGGMLALGPLGWRLFPNAILLFAESREGDPETSLRKTLWYGWFSLLMVVYMFFFTIERQTDINRLQGIGWAALWGVSLILGYRFIPPRSNRPSHLSPGPAGREFYIDHDE